MSHYSDQREIHRMKTTEKLQAYRDMLERFIDLGNYQGHEHDLRHEVEVAASDATVLLGWIDD